MLRYKRQRFRRSSGDHEDDVVAGRINESYELTELIDQHQRNTKIAAKTIVANCKYGTIWNYIACQERNYARTWPIYWSVALAVAVATGSTQIGDFGPFYRRPSSGLKISRLCPYSLTLQNSNRRERG
jgi:hypothetical protein